MKLFNENQIYNIYNKYIIKNDNYYNRYKYINQYLSNKELQLYKNIDTPRLMSLIDFKEWIKKYNFDKVNKLLYTCPNDIELKYLKYNFSDLIEYPPYDLHTLRLPRQDYDLIMFNQTLEHLYNPFICIQNLYDHLANDGLIYTTVPTINIPHMIPIHFWGITPIGLCLLMMSAGFEILECGYWGNKKYIEYIFTQNNWPGYEKISNNYDLSYDSVCQAQTWILAKK